MIVKGGFVHVAFALIKRITIVQSVFGDWINLVFIVKTFILGRCYGKQQKNSEMTANVSCLVKVNLLICEGSKTNRKRRRKNDFRRTN